MPSKPQCPVCEELTEGMDENDYFPFCSRRCKRIDLGRWFNEEYTIPLTPHSTERSLEPDDEETGGDP